MKNTKKLAIISIAYGLIVKTIEGFSDFYYFWIILGFVLLLDRKIMNIAIGLLLGIIILSQELIISRFSNRLNKDLDYILVLGYASENQRVNETLKGRLDLAYSYLRDNTSKAILSGGQSDRTTIEAEIMKDYLVNKGIGESRLIREDRAESTYENLAFSKKLMEEGSSLGIVSSDYHIYRASIMAKDLGVEVDSFQGSKSPLILYPNNLTREFFALVKYFIRRLYEATSKGILSTN